MQTEFSSDIPIVLNKQDRFNRSKFSQRIAETIIQRNGNDGLVIGLYGIWGEGKTSVLNMKEEFLPPSEGTVIVKFNPWRFKDEETLIRHFFKNISAALDKELANLKEKVGKFLSKYGSIGSIVNLDLEKFGDSLSDAELVELKARVGDFLKEGNKKVVVIIDDIDRLDKQELFALFKLIKLTGDFPKTFYLLSFDDEMVASSIGERFGEGNKIAGYSFLEKIIQIPLRIPLALSGDLLNFTFDLINDVLKSHNISLGNEENDVGSQISRNILPRLQTPRLALRYANSLSFLIPLLKGEVNLADLILFEGVRLFYPTHYDFVKKYPEYFLEAYENSYRNGSNEAKKKEFKDKMEHLNVGLSKNESRVAIDLLTRLFPYIKEAISNHNYSYRNRNWTKEKRISSSKYFNRYFLYSIPQNDISDVYFEGFLQELENCPILQLDEEVSEMIVRVGAAEFLSKISTQQDELNWNQKKILIRILCRLQNTFEGRKGGDFLLTFNPKAQAAGLITTMLEKDIEYNDLFQFLIEIIQISDLPFSFELIYWLHSAIKRDEFIIKIEDIEKIENSILRMALINSKNIGSNLFETYPMEIFKLLDIWHRESPNELFEYIDNCLMKDNDFAEVIIDTLTTTIISSSYPEPYKTDFKKENYHRLKKYYSTDTIYQFLSQKKYEHIKNLELRFFESDQGHTKDSAIRQFIHWHEEEKKAMIN